MNNGIPPTARSATRGRVPSILYELHVTAGELHIEVAFEDIVRGGVVVWRIEKSDIATVRYNPEISFSR
jgi:hypothetical protein